MKNCKNVNSNRSITRNIDYIVLLYINLLKGRR